MSVRRSFVQLGIASITVTALGGGTGCDLLHVNEPAVLLPDQDAVVFPFDITRECRFQIATVAEPASDTAWTAAGDISNRPFHALAKKHETSRSPDGPLADDAIELRDSDGKVTWIRFEPKANQPAGDPLKCATPLHTVESLDKPLRASSVRILPTARSCHSIDLVTGAPEDVDLEPYALLLRRLYKTPSGLALGVTVGEDVGANPSGGRPRLLTLSEDQFNECFAKTARAALPPDRQRALVDWVARGAATEPPANVAFDPALVLLGLDEHGCLHEGTGASQHRECRAPAVRSVRRSADGVASSMPSVSFVRDRVVDAVHGYGPDLVSSAELAQVNFVLTPPSGKSSAFTKEFESALGDTVTDPNRQLTRAASGYRLLRRADLAKIQAPFVTVQMDISTSTDSGSSAAPAATAGTSPASPAAAPAGTIGQLSGVDESAELAALFALKEPSCLDESAAAICNVQSKTSAADLIRRRAAASAKPAAAGAFASADATSLAMNGHRIGSVTVKLSGTESGADDAKSARLVFGATRGPILTQAAGALAADDLDRAAARAALRTVDRALEDWMARAGNRPAENALLPGTRAHMSLLAQHAASNRNVKLISDLLDERNEAVNAASGAGASYPVTLADATAGQCFTFVAAASDGTPVDVNLSVRHDDEKNKAVVGRDLRPALTGAFEVCNLEAGAYRADVSFGGPGTARPAGLVMSVFESTPDKVSDADLRFSTSGAPTPFGSK